MPNSVDEGIKFELGHHQRDSCRGVSDPLRYNLDVGGLAELADAGVSKTPESNLISVRFRYPPPSGDFPKNQCNDSPVGSVGAEADLRKKVGICTFSSTVLRYGVITHR